MGRKKTVSAPQATAFVPLSTSPEAVIKREVSVSGQIDTLQNTIIYGEGDSLPLRIARLVNESPAALACINTISKYIKGSKFSSDNLMKLKVDKYGTTLWQLHTKICDTLALFDGFSVNFKFDRNGKITHTYPLSFESCRLTKPDDNGYITEIKYNPYFGTGEKKTDQTVSYPIFDTKEVLNQIAKEKTKFKGQVYYYGKTSPLYRFYPVPDYWSAKNWINIDGKIQEFHASNLDKGFFQTIIWNIIGDPSQPSPNPNHKKTWTDEKGIKHTESTKTQGEAFTEMMTAAFAGSSKAGGGIGLWSQNAETATKFQAAPTNQNSDLFTTLQDLTTKNITIATQVPGILANISEGVNLGSGGSEIQKAVELMQSNTKEERNLLEQFYNEILLPNLSVATEERVEIVNYNPITVPIEIEDKLWEQFTAKEKRAFTKANVNFTFDDDVIDDAPSKRTLIEIIGVGGTQALMDIIAQYAQGLITEVQAINILQILFGVSIDEAKRIVSKGDGTGATIMPDGTITQPAVTVEPETKVNENLKNLTGRQLQGIQRVVRKFNKGELTYEQARQLLVSGHGITEEEVDVWLITPDEE